jgi:hypothetical protein
MREYVHVFERERERECETDRNRGVCGGSRRREEVRRGRE